jgi:hypothetical protein
MGSSHCTFGVLLHIGLFARPKGSDDARTLFDESLWPNTRPA